MTKYYVYEYKVIEIDGDNHTVTPVFNIEVSDSKLHTTKISAFSELRDILSIYCEASRLTAEPPIHAITL